MWGEVWRSVGKAYGVSVKGMGEVGRDGGCEGRCREVCWGVWRQESESVGKCVGSGGGKGKCEGGVKECMEWVWKVREEVWESVLERKEG